MNSPFTFGTDEMLMTSDEPLFRFVKTVGFQGMTLINKSSIQATVFVFFVLSSTCPWY